MIGDGWDGDPSVRPSSDAEDAGRPRRRVCVVTGSRAEFGLLRPAMHAIHKRSDLELAVVAAGSHLISPAETLRDVKAEFNIADAVPMQIAGRTGRYEDAESVSRGIGRFARSYERLRPDWVVVLGDRIEAFAAAASASIAGLAVAHAHGGDRAEGVADEAMRHAITKLAHLHLPATATSRDRIVRMGERPEHVIVVGSPAIDDLGAMPEMAAAAFEELGSPIVVVLLHPVGRPAEIEEADAATLLEAAVECAGGDRSRVLGLMPNHDAGRSGIVRALEASGVRRAEHMPRAAFVGMLRALSRAGGVLAGNSSAALIECAALRVPVVNVGPRQAGRERSANVVDADHVEHGAVVRALTRARGLDLARAEHPFGDGHAGERIAAAIAGTNPHDPALLRKRNTY
ncbi:MAG: UDP-N-acetylglucosamine 2-epimerase [Phycisphaerales bacterium]